MAGLTLALQQSTLDYLFPTTGARLAAGATK